MGKIVKVGIINNLIMAKHIGEVSDYLFIPITDKMVSATLNAPKPKIA